MQPTFPLNEAPRRLCRFQSRVAHIGFAGVLLVQGVGRYHRPVPDKPGSWRPSLTVTRPWVAGAELSPTALDTAVSDSPLPPRSGGW